MVDLIQDENSPGSWATPVERLSVAELPPEAINLNVAGRPLAGVVRGFGQLWQKTYRMSLPSAEVTPQRVIATWKENFPKYWPKGNRFYGPAQGIIPGSVAVLNLAGPGGINAPGGAPMISTGVLVLYADDTSFAFLTPRGHMFAGMITFSAEQENGLTITQVQALIRANDPLYELTMRLKFGHHAEDTFWAQTLKSLAAEFGRQVQVDQEIVCLDPKVQWSEAGNIWQNAAIRTGIYYTLTPVRWARRCL